VEIMTVDITIPLDDAAARALQADPIKRQALGRLISHWLQPEGQADILLDAMDRLSIHSETGGLTEIILNEELAAYSRERRD
jgi:hypothetical protein